jgi:hypothetical protein
MATFCAEKRNFSQSLSLLLSISFPNRGHLFAAATMSLLGLALHRPQLQIANKTPDTLVIGRHTILASFLLNHTHAQSACSISKCKVFLSW